jgi:hypothetical protein
VIVAEVTGEDVADLLAATSEDPESAVWVVRAMARAYTRGRGFDGETPTEEIAAVITAAAARLTANPAQIPVDNTTGPFSQSIRGAFQGWTLAEQIVLNRYRVRAM